MNQLLRVTGSNPILSMSSAPLPQSHFFDERYAQKEKQLSQFIQLSTSQIFVAKFDSTKNEFISASHYLLGEENKWDKVSRKLEQVLLEDQFQQAKNTSLCISNSLYTLVPLALFDEKELETYIQFNHTVTAGTTLHYAFNKIESLATVVVYAIPRAIHYLLKAKLPPYRQYHLSYPLLEAILLQPKVENNLYIHIQDKRFEIIYVPKQQLNYFNSFEYTTAEDLIYFLLYVMEQLQLDQEKIQLTVLGEVEKKSSIYQYLYRYIRNVQLIERSANVKFSTVLSEIPQQYYFSLFNQHLCE